MVSHHPAKVASRMAVWVRVPYSLPIYPVSSVGVERRSTKPKAVGSSPTRDAMRGDVIMVVGLS